MNDHSPSPGTSQPGTLLLRTAGTCHLDMPYLVEVFGEQRQRFGGAALPQQQIR